jgi:hypothetical protein
MSNRFDKKKISFISAGTEQDEFKQDINVEESAIGLEQIQNQQQPEIAVTSQTQAKQKDIPTDEEIKQDMEQNKLQENGIIVLKKKDKKKTKDYKNIFISTTTIALIKKYSKELNIGESALIDMLLKDAFNRIEIK